MDTNSQAPNKGPPMAPPPRVPVDAGLLDRRDESLEDQPGLYVNSFPPIHGLMGFNGI